MKTNIYRTLLYGITLACASNMLSARILDTAHIDKLKTYHFGQDDSALTAIQQEVNASRSDVVQRKQAASALAAVLGSDATLDAKQFACRELVLIASDEQIPALIPLLDQEDLSHYAIMVLDRIPGEAVNKALLKRLPTLDIGKPGNINTCAEIHTMLGLRKEPEAIQPLAKAFSYKVPVLYRSAARALGNIGSPAASKALTAAWKSAAADRKHDIGMGLAICADRLAASGDKQKALSIYHELDGAVTDPLLRSAALRGFVSCGDKDAVRLMLDALKDDNTPRQTTALDIARTDRQAITTEKLCSFLPGLSAEAGGGRTLLMEALIDRGDPAAGKTIRDLCKSPDQATRAVAFRALATLGDSTSVAPLLAMAASGSTEEKEAARNSLSRLPGVDVDKKLIAAVTSGEEPVRLEAIRAVGLRRSPGAVVVLTPLLKSPSKEIRSASLGVLKNMGDPAVIPLLLDIALAQPTGSRDALFSAISEIARRAAKPEERTGVILKRYAALTAPADRAELLGLLGEIGGQETYNTFLAAMKDTASAVRQQAIATMTEWPDDTPMNELLAVIRTSTDPGERALALRGYARMISLNDQRSEAATLQLFKDTLAMAQNTADKRILLSGLAKMRSPGALDMAVGLMADRDLQEEAQVAIVQIAKATAGAWRNKTRGVIEPISKTGLNEQSRKDAVDILTWLDKSADYVTAWQVSPLYVQQGANYSDLFDIAFAPELPEKSKSEVWRVFSPTMNLERPYIMDLLALYGGEQRVAYLRTIITCEQDIDLTLEIGSDDGFKLWWNGQLIDGKNVQRACSPAQDKVIVHAKKGPNALMLKINQNIMGWETCLHIVESTGVTASIDN